MKIQFMHIPKKTSRAFSKLYPEYNLRYKENQRPDENKIPSRSFKKGKKRETKNQQTK